MCNRCDGGNKELEKLQCNNPECNFVFYKVAADEETGSFQCPKCRIGIGTTEKDGEK